MLSAAKKSDLPFCTAKLSRFIQIIKYFVNFAMHNFSENKTTPRNA